jgi:hypothetical protein
MKQRPVRRLVGVFRKNRSIKVAEKLFFMMSEEAST